jgi:F-type H+-transporting ATPase subunit b
MKIDWWTLGLQTVNVLILIWLLARFFWRPLAAMIAQRRTAAELMLTQAEEKRAQADAALAAAVQARAGFAQERDAILAAARTAAAQARTAVIEAAAREAAALGEAAKGAIARDQAATEAEWADHASRLAVEIAGRLAGRLHGSTVHQAFLNWLTAEIGALPAASRKAAVGSEIEVITAEALSPEDQAQARQRIAGSFGGELRISFGIDAGLIAGFELRGAGVVLRNSWRADLEQIQQELSHER